MHNSAYRRSYWSLRGPCAKGHLIILKTGRFLNGSVGCGFVHTRILVEGRGVGLHNNHVKNWRVSQWVCWVYVCTCRGGSRTLKKGEGGRLL